MKYFSHYCIYTII